MPPDFSREIAIENQKPAFLYWLFQRRVHPGLYIFAYHTVLDLASAEEWERAYTKIAIAADYFEAHLAWLTSNMTPITQAESLHLTPDDLCQRAYFIIHFDDGYATLPRTALPLAQRYGIRPVVFVNGDFASQNVVYYRVVAAVMDSRGQGDALHKALQEFGFSPPENPDDLFPFLKNHYSAGKTEQVVARAWELANPGEPPPAAYLDWDGLKNLAEAGWEIGNHTRNHPTLTNLSQEEHEAQINGNEALMRDAGLQPAPYLAYPNGLAQHVGEGTLAWQKANPTYHSFFAGGGVNLEIRHWDWLRIATGNWSLDALKRQVYREGSRTYRWYKS
jgi:peptidoglycan/xylan/chitin deacetylase (PgdA/CDA1 family)